MSPILRKAVEMTNRPIRIVYVKMTESESLPNDGIDFNELVSTKGWMEQFLLVRYLIDYFLQQVSISAA